MYVTGRERERERECRFIYLIELRTIPIRNCAQMCGGRQTSDHRINQSRLRTLSLQILFNCGGVCGARSARKWRVVLLADHIKVC